MYNKVVATVVVIVTELLDADRFPAASLALL
jgi:hypothetical protein